MNTSVHLIVFSFGSGPHSVKQCCLHLEWVCLPQLTTSRNSPQRSVSKILSSCHLILTITGRIRLLCKLKITAAIKASFVRKGERRFGRARSSQKIIECLIDQSERELLNDLDYRDVDKVETDSILANRFTLSFFAYFKLLHTL